MAERAIPIAIFQAEPSVCKHYLKKWLRAQSNSELEVRNFLDWEYYIERMNGCIQKIITIPAALQGVLNPVTRVPHPDWLHKKLAERNDTFRQKKIDDIFSLRPRQPILAELNEPENVIADIEDLTNDKTANKTSKPILVTQKTNVTTYGKTAATKRKHDELSEKPDQSWKEILGEPPKIGKTMQEFDKWHTYQKQKWKLQIDFRRQKKSRPNKTLVDSNESNNTSRFANVTRSITDFVQKSTNTRMEKPWQILSISETNSTGIFKMWIQTDAEVYSVISLCFCCCPFTLKN